MLPSCLAFLEADSLARVPEDYVSLRSWLLSARFQSWSGYLREICSEDAERRKAALKLPPVRIEHDVDALVMH